MNFEKVGNCFFQIYNKKTKKTREVYVSNNEAKKNMDILVANDDEEFQMIPCRQKEREVIYCTGKSGSGKTTWASSYAERYHEMYPKNLIILFSMQPEDKNFASKKYIKKIDLSKYAEADQEDDINLEDLKNSLVLIDDCDAEFMENHRLLLRKMENLQAQIMGRGRHFSISLVLIRHMAAAGNKTRNILMETNALVFFPHHMTHRVLTYLLGSHIGISKSEQKKLLELAQDTRSVAYIQNYPSIIFSSKKCYILRQTIN